MIHSTYYPIEKYVSPIPFNELLLNVNSNWKLYYLQVCSNFQIQIFMKPSVPELHICVINVGLSINHMMFYFYQILRPASPLVIHGEVYKPTPYL